jgi:hypothetical protein
MYFQKRTKVISILSLVFLFFTIAACSGLDPEKKEVAADPLVINSFVPGKNSSLTIHSSTLGVRKSALEKEFLLQAQMLSQTDAPQFKGMKSRIVAFRRVANTVYLLEATKGHVVSNDIPSTLILASLPITNENKDIIYVDFNTGFSELYQAKDWRASDLSGASYVPGNEFQSTNLKHAHIAKMAYTRQNQILIVQRGQLVRDIPNGNSNTPVETRYYLSPYYTNTNYTPVTTADFRRVGFFEVASQYLSDGSLGIFATRFNPSREKKIIYAISANMPQEFRQAAKDGVLYWNKAFGYEKVQVVDAPENVTAPDPNYNMVQWITWDTAGMAYADAQMDPRTGEILHAQVFMTSVFALMGKHSARQVLRRLKTDENHFDIGLKNFEQNEDCNKLHHAEFFDHVRELIAANVEDSSLLLAAQNYVREVVAHEIGHTLGLRHNFAGSLNSNRSPQETDHDFHSLLNHQDIDSKNIYTNSVMEYTSFPAGVLFGEGVRKNHAAMDYDVMAINYLYHEKKDIPANAPLFCTDSVADLFIGCRRGDTGPSPIEDAMYLEKKSIELVPENLIEKLLLAKYPMAGTTSREFSEVAHNTKATAEAIMANRRQITPHLLLDTKELRVTRKLGKLDSTNEKLVLQMRIDDFDKELHRLGGMGVLFPAPAANLKAIWLARFDKLIQSDKYRNGSTIYGAPYSLSDSDIAQAREVATIYFDSLYEALLISEIESLKIATAMINFAAADSFADVLYARAKEYLFTTSGNTFKDKILYPVVPDSKKPDDKTTANSKNQTTFPFFDFSTVATVPPLAPALVDGEIELPIFKYSYKLRYLTGAIYTGYKSDSLIWAVERKEALKNEFKEFIKSILKDNEIEKFKTIGHSPSVSQWLAENKSVNGQVSKN